MQKIGDLTQQLQQLKAEKEAMEREISTAKEDKRKYEAQNKAEIDRLYRENKEIKQEEQRLSGLVRDFQQQKQEKDQ